MTDRVPRAGVLTWKAVHALWITAFIVLLLSATFGATRSLSGAVLAMLASLLGYSVGGLLGFLFGFPRYSDPAAISNTEDLKTVLAGSPKNDGKRRSLGANTNLERIVDWLMTMIVGATLVNLERFVAWTGRRFSELATAISGTDGQAVHGILLVVPFAIAGFLHLYLWARRFLPGEWNEADLALERIDQLEKKTDLIDSGLAAVKTEVFKVEADALRALAKELAAGGASQATIDDITKRLGTASNFDDDPYEGFGPATAAGFSLSATVGANPTPDPEDPYLAAFSVKREDGTPFSGMVAFLLHNTYDPPYLIRQASNSTQVSAEVSCCEGSVLGAIVAPAPGAPAQETVRLSLDLNKLSDVPAKFRHR